VEGVTDKEAATLVFLHDLADKGCMQRPANIASPTRFDSLKQLLVKGRACRPLASRAVRSQQF
jgi:hypothetical protein